MADISPKGDGSFSLLLFISLASLDVGPSSLDVVIASASSTPIANHLRSLITGGGTGVTKNRTYWPIGGGTIAFQPGWFRGHLTAFLQVNLGFGSDPSANIHGGPPNMSNPMVHPFQILGPTNNPYPGTVCLTQVPLPVGANVKPGDEATIQVVETAQHGAALYSCVDIIFVEPGDHRIAPVNESNCYNSTDIGFADIYSITRKESGSDNYTNVSAAERTLHSVGWAGWTPLFLATAALLML